jgi:hypothetical protein
MPSIWTLHTVLLTVPLLPSFPMRVRENSDTSYAHFFAAGSLLPLLLRLPWRTVASQVSGMCVVMQCPKSIAYLDFGALPTVPRPFKILVTLSSVTGTLCRLRREAIRHRKLNVQRDARQNESTMQVLKRHLAVVGAGCLARQITKTTKIVQSRLLPDLLATPMLRYVVIASFRRGVSSFIVAMSICTSTSYIRLLTFYL